MSQEYRCKIEEHIAPNNRFLARVVGLPLFKDLFSDILTRRLGTHFPSSEKEARDVLARIKARGNIGIKDLPRRDIR